MRVQGQFGEGTAQLRRSWQVGGAGWQSPEAVRGTWHLTGMDRRGPGLPLGVPCRACPLETTRKHVHVLWLVSGAVRSQVGAVGQETTPFRLTIVSSD